MAPNLLAALLKSIILYLPGKMYTVCPFLHEQLVAINISDIGMVGGDIIWTSLTIRWTKKVSWDLHGLFMYSTQTTLKKMKKNKPSQPSVVLYSCYYIELQWILTNPNSSNLNSHQSEQWKLTALLEYFVKVYVLLK